MHVREAGGCGGTVVDVALEAAAYGAGDYAALPWFWSDQADYKLQIAGLAQPDDRAEALDAQTVLRFDAQDRLTAVETVNNAKAHMKTRKALGAGALLDPVQARELLA